MNRLVATVGMPGAGKSEVVKFFEDQHYAKVYFGGIVLDHLKVENLEINETNEKMMREKLREIHGMAAMAKLALPKIETALRQDPVIIDGLYSWEEYLVLKEKFPTLQVVAVYAPFEVRAARLAQRKVRPLSADEVRSRDQAQIEKLHTAGPIAMADWTLINTGTREELLDQLQRWNNGRKTAH